MSRHNILTSVISQIRLLHIFVTCDDVFVTCVYHIGSVRGVTQQVAIHVIDHTCDTFVPLPPHV